MKGKLYLLRGSFLLFVTLVVHSILFSQQLGKSIPYAASPEGAIGFLEFRPADYGSQKHPLIIFLHGYGERGNGSSSQVGSVAVNGIPNLCANGASMRFTVGGQTSSFVVLSPQLSTWYGYWPTFYITEMIKYAKANLSIDPNRIYITGLSLGGGATWRAITEAGTENNDFSFDAGIAAAAPVCGTQEENDGYFCRTIGDNHLPVWAFHSMDDGTVGVGTTQHAEILAGICGVSPAMKFTYYQTGNHGGAWVNAYDTGHITRTVSDGSSFTANPNLYEWFLAHTRSAAPSYTAPVASAGSAQIITLPINSLTLSGSGSGTNGASITSYSWVKTSGPAGGAISVPLLNTTLVTGLVEGTYVFTLTVTDNHGLINSSSVTITVNPPPNQLPVSNAGNNATITLPVNSAVLNGSASSDPDGSISSYLWTKTSGPVSYLITDANAASTTVTNLAQGTYIFTLKVTDNAGASASAPITVTVNVAALPANQSPIANAGSNSSITLPVNSLILDGSASADADGSISSYSWNKTSGPEGYSIVNPGAAKSVVNNLVQGTYIFSLQVTDNMGATAVSAVTITVNAALPPLPVNQPPVAKAGNDIYLTLPVNYTTLDGSGSMDQDGNISSYAWSKTSGPESYSITNMAAASTALSNLNQGVYVFTLKITDNAGAASSATVTVTVNAAFAATPPPNLAPIVNAGTNTSITLPVNTVTLDGSSSTDPDGMISSYAWTKISGPGSYSISNMAAATTAVTSLVQGIYVFGLTITDNGGAIASSSVIITVNRQPNNTPVSNAGPDISISLPVNSLVLDGSLSFDPDGSINAFSWTKINGPGAVTIANSATARATVIGLQEGQYQFALTVTDNDGATSTDQVVVTVLPQPNKAPVANAGSDTSVALPVSSIVLSGINSTDPDGSLSGYTWKQVSGPSAGVFTQPTAVSTRVTSLIEGDYIFELQVTDNGGATANATVKVSVLNNFRYIQFFKLYPNPAVNTVSFQFIDDKTGKLMVGAYDVNGRLVLSEEISKEQSLITKQLDISKLKPGMYYLEIKQADGTKLIRPFVKQ